MKSGSVRRVEVKSEPEGGGGVTDGSVKGSSSEGARVTVIIKATEVLSREASSPCVPRTVSSRAQHLACLRGQLHQAKAVGGARQARRSEPRVAYLVLNFVAGWKKQTILPSLAYAGMPYQSFAVSAGALALMTA